MAVIGTALLCSLLFVALRTGEATGAEGDGCAPVCVVLIQVDGLEPKDVNETTTPYLWRLAHPKVQSVPVPGVALDGRSGWIWQAPRSVASTGLAPATASLLTGAFPKTSGIPTNDFYGPGEVGNSIVHQRVTAEGFGDAPDAGAGSDVAQPVGPPRVDTVLSEARNVTDVAVFLGDPGLAGVTEATTQGAPHWFPPGDDPSATHHSDSQFTGDPRLCPIPRYPDGGVEVGQQPRSENFNPSRCPANDMTTANKAIADLKQPTSTSVGFTFMHLAELGAAKRLAADPDAPADELSLPEGDTARPPQVPQALANMDQAVATFVEQLAQHDPAKWDKTVVMVTGTHGYQPTPLAQRVPDPENPSVSYRDLSDYVAEFRTGGTTPLRLVPQGTMATIYYGLDGDAGPAARRDAVDAIKGKLATEIDEGCRARDPSLDPSVGGSGRCLKGIYYVDPTNRPSAETVDGAFKTWNLDTRDPDTGARTGASGDLVVLLEPGWSFGRAPGLPQAIEADTPITNPNTASAGGPRERAVAALVNGPSAASSPGAVRDLDSLAASELGVSDLKRYPVRNSLTDTSNPEQLPPVDDAACPDTPTDPGGLSCANDPAKVVDDAEDPGHRAQPVTVDFAYTISTLLQLPFESHPDQLQGRALQEAFLNELSRPGIDVEPPLPPTCLDVAELTFAGTPVAVTMDCRDESREPLTYEIVSGPARGTLGPVTGNSVTYTPAPGFSGIDSFTYRASTVHGPAEEVATAFITVAEPPVVQRDEGFKFTGLVQKLKAVVVNSKDHTYARARRGSVLSTIRLEGDFGKPEAAVTLTFYRRVASASRTRRRGGRRGGRRVVRLKAIARFDPFVVKRGHVKMRLKVPEQFKPQYVGLTVREIARTASGARRKKGAQACTTLRTHKPVPFRCTGPSRGVIVRIADAHRLHKRKVGSRATPRRRR